MRSLLVLLVATLALLSALPLVAEEAPKPTPYVTVYRSDAVAFQIRRDRIKTRPDGAYMVWLRWLYAEAQPWKTDKEVARLSVADLDCTQLRVRELAVLHKNREGTIFDTQEFTAEQAVWKSFDAKTGAGAALKRACEFIPQLLAPQP